MEKNAELLRFNVDVFSDNNSASISGDVDDSDDDRNDDKKSSIMIVMVKFNVLIMRIPTKRNIVVAMVIMVG